ncbi:DUF7537 family lipoprotein [Haloglomus litoreum]|uniref:DUF7537 family lipoprotein n=1 Tax=Haloglomus litoreum TaxID=3034026 RepID=UPI0023E83131|nr:hypothetical protein [Haloglomus sp. DT116]
MRDSALSLTLCVLLVLSGCSLFGGAGTPTATDGPASPTGTPTPTFGPAVYDAADAAASTDRLREAGSWNATLTTRYESNRSRPDLDEYPIELALRANASVGHLQVTERRADGRVETTFVDDSGGYVRERSADGDVDYRWASRPNDTLLVDALTYRALAGTQLRYVDDPGELPLAKVGYERVDDEVVAVYEANASESGFDPDRSLLVPEEARLVQYEQRLTLASDGRLVGRTVTVEWVHPDREERVTYQRSFRLGAVDGVTVERPGWVDEARQTADESAEEN